MGLETGVTYIEDLNAAWPDGSVDTMDEIDSQIQNVKTGVQGSFPNLGALAVTKTADEINNAQGQVVPATANNLAMLDTSGDLTDSLVESDGAGNITANVTGDLVGDVDGNVTGNVSGTALSVTGTGVVDTVHIATAAIETAELANSAVTDSKMASPAAGSLAVKRILGTDERDSDTSGSYDATTILADTTNGILLGTALVSGVIRVTFDMKSSGGGLAQAVVKVNSTRSSPVTDTSTTFVTKAIEVSVTVGDNLILQFMAGSAHYNTITQLSVTCLTRNMAVA